MREHLKAFLAYLRFNRNASPHTVRAYESDIGQYLGVIAADLDRQLSKLVPRDLNPTTVRMYLAELGRRGDARSSMARKLSGLRTFLRYLRREGIIDEDPAALAIAPRREQTLPAHLSEEEMSRLLEMPSTADPLGCRDRAILELFYASGLRLSELVGLDLENLDLRGRLVRVMGKGSKERIVPFNHATERAIREWLKHRAAMVTGESAKTEGRGRKSDPLFVNYRGTRLSGRSVHRLVLRYVSQCRMRCGIPLPRTCSSAARTCAPFRSCSGMRASARRSATRTSTRRS
jgi:integrase/recombinase XerC